MRQYAPLSGMILVRDRSEDVSCAVRRRDIKVRVFGKAFLCCTDPMAIDGLPSLPTVEAQFIRRDAHCWSVTLMKCCLCNGILSCENYVRKRNIARGPKLGSWDLGERAKVDVVNGTGNEINRILICCEHLLSTRESSLTVIPNIGRIVRRLLNSSWKM